MDAKLKQSQQDYEKVVEQFERAIPTKKVSFTHPTIGAI